MGVVIVGLVPLSVGKTVALDGAGGTASFATAAAMDLLAFLYLDEATNIAAPA